MRAHRFGDLDDEAHPVRFGAAIFVGALVGALRQELVHEIAVGAVQLQHVEAGLHARAARALPQACTRSLTSCRLQRPRHRPFLAVGDRARRHRRPRRPSRRSRAVRFSGPSPSHGRLARALRPEWPSWMPATAFCCLMNLTRRLSGSTKASSQMPRSPTVPQPRRSTLVEFDHDEAGAAGRELAGIHQMPVGRKALHRRILVHRRHHDAVLQL